jgi:tyramine---L-glutamate ligase
MVLASGGRLLGPDLQTIRLTSDKHSLSVFLHGRGVSVPHGVAIETGDTVPADFAFPAVLKPRDGAGSVGIEVIDAAADAAHHARVTQPARLEKLCPGLACSVAVLCGRRGCVSLEPCRQHVRRDCNFRYDGGSLPLEDALARRARRLAEQAVAILPGALGYLGVDLVLGDDPSGSQDVVIEINPRVTTSYVGLRAATQQNLAEAMIAIAADETCQVSFRREPIEFRPDGRITAGASA